MTAFAACKIDGCRGNAHYSAKGARGWCNKHYLRWCAHGDPLGGGTGKGEPLAWLHTHKDYDGDSCLIWPFMNDLAGYAKIMDGEQCPHAARVMCRLVNGEPPAPDLDAAHSCGRGAAGCVHPKHLRWATKVENAADKIAHGTTNRGERQGRHKLTEENVRTIRSLLGGATHSQIAKRFNVSPGAIGLIATGKNWGWLV